MKTKILNKLLPLIENVDFIISEDLSTLTPIQKQRIKTETIFYDAVFASPEFWTKENVLQETSEQLLEDGSIDTSWTHVPEVIENDIVISLEHWTKTITEKVFENPNDESFTYHAAVEAKDAYSEVVNVKETIHHEAVEAVLDAEGNILTPAIEAYDEVVDVIETYTELLPDFETLKLSLIDNLGMAINQFLSTKTFERTKDDGICFKENGFDWFFKNLEKPKAEELYIAYETYLANKTEEERKQAIIETGKKAREACDKALDVISGYNQERELTPEQITEMATTFTPIINALSILKRPGVAKGLIQAATVDGVVITEAMKVDILDALKDF